MVYPTRNQSEQGVSGNQQELPLSFLELDFAGATTQSLVKKMSRSTAILAALLPILLLACKRQQNANLEPTGQEAIPQIDLSPNEVEKHTNALFLGVEDSSSILDSGAYLSMKALHGPAFKRELIRRIGQADDITIIEHSFWTDFIRPGSISIGDAYRTERDAPKYEYRSDRKSVV